MNNEIKALDLAIAKLQEQKAQTIKKLMDEKKDKKQKSDQKITPKDKVLIKKLTKQAKWWREEGPTVEKTIKVTIKANILWTEDTNPHIDGYDILYNGKSFDFDDLTGILFEEHLEKYKKQINTICDLTDKLEKKYPDSKLVNEIFI